MGFGLVLVGAGWVYSLKRGRKAADNPWGSNTLEWRSSSPPPHDNFKVLPVADDPYDLEGWVYDPKIDGWIKEAVPAAKKTAHGH